MLAACSACEGQEGKSSFRPLRFDAPPHLLTPLGCRHHGGAAQPGRQPAAVKRRRPLTPRQNPTHPPASTAFRKSQMPTERITASVPRIAVVLCLPSALDGWLHNATCLVMQHAQSAAAGLCPFMDSSNRLCCCSASAQLKKACNDGGRSCGSTSGSSPCRRPRKRGRDHLTPQQGAGPTPSRLHPFRETIHNPAETPQAHTA